MFLTEIIMNTNNSLHVCVIGAGQAGLIACKHLSEHGIPFTCFEKGSYIGGMWNLDNDNGMSSAYENLELNTSKQKSGISGFAMPDEYPNFITIKQMYEYLTHFADNYELKKHIKFQTTISNITKTDLGVWKIETNHGNTHTFSHVIVATGSNSFPNMPQSLTQFTGNVLHSKEYKTNTDFTDRNVLVVGLGSSGAEIACDLKGKAKNIFVSVKKMPLIMPKYLLGRPADHWVSPASSHLPKFIQNRLFTLLIWLTQGSQTQYNVPSPEMDVSEHNPTVSNHFLQCCKKGFITIKRAMKQAQSNTVWFEDGSTHKIDSIIYATGYRCRFPFFKDGFLSCNNNPLPLYKKIYHPMHDHLYFLGFIAPRGPVIPLVDKQMQWIAQHIQSKISLPNTEIMLNTIDREMQAKSIHSNEKQAGNMLRVDLYPYMQLLQADV